MAAPDVIFVLPYTAADHPSFPEGILRRSLEAAGFSVGLIERPRWQSDADFRSLGRPRLFFAIVSGPVDSLVAGYTSARRRRREDLYQEDGSAFFPGAPPSVSSRVRPDRAVVAFANRLRQAWRGAAIVIGGVEATMRRFSHYDFIDGAVRRSILLDARADLLVFGPGELQLVEIARRAAAGEAPGGMEIPGTARISPEPPAGAHVRLPAHEEAATDPARLLELQLAAEAPGQVVVQPAADRFIVQQPGRPYRGADLDEVYGLPYERRHVASVRNERLSPALAMNLFSITSHRGCAGACSFCAIAGQQGRRVVSRSPESILREAAALARHRRWRGVISDIGGPTAEMYGMDLGGGRYGDRYLELLRAARGLPGVKSVLLGSGMRYDLLMQNPSLLEEILRFHSGRFLRVAPEHTEAHVLDLMRKAPFARFRDFVSLFNSFNRRAARPVELALYLIVGHPGETAGDVRAMKEKLRDLRLTRLDVQIFTPSPGTLATAMFHAGTDPAGRPLAVERSAAELARRRNLLAAV